VTACWKRSKSPFEKEEHVVIQDDFQWWESDSRNICRMGMDKNSQRLL